MSYSSKEDSSQIEFAGGVWLFQGPKGERPERPKVIRAVAVLMAFLKNSVFFMLFCDLGKEATSEKHGVGTIAHPL